MTKHGFEVTKKFHLDTAWQATFSHGLGGRTVGINSEVRRDIDRLLANWLTVGVDGCFERYRPRMWPQSHWNIRLVFSLYHETMDFN